MGKKSASYGPGNTVVFYDTKVCLLTLEQSGFGGVGVSMLAFSTQVRGFKPGRSCWIFKGEKILSTPSFGGEVKLLVQCRRFAACKRSLNVAWKLTLGKITGQVPPFAARHLSCCVDMGGHLAAEAGTSKSGGDPGLHNKPLGYGASEVYASGPACEEEELWSKFSKNCYDYL